MLKKKFFTATALTVPFALMLTGCSVTDLAKDNYDKSASKSASTSEQGVAEGLLPNWVPAGGTEVKLEQRTTGSERLMVMDYSGALPSEQCTPLGSTGAPTAKELSAAYATDQRSKGWEVSDVATSPTLEADWWPQDAHQATTQLCGRWWVHQDGGKLYAFAPDLLSVTTQIEKQRENA